MRNLEDIRAGANCLGCLYAVDHAPPVTAPAVPTVDVRCHRFPPALSLSPFQAKPVYPQVTVADVCGEYGSAGS